MLTGQFDCNGTKESQKIKYKCIFIQQSTEILNV